ncbi:probable ATP-dependent RNA helicase spindle-E [Eurosta solidaginis]|uniref:probable ATP-dependent RNA helicase spindle-E n=1 Tax=Eurosta solidaginis TaxID=178769 RepID=UPI003530CB41
MNGRVYRLVSKNFYEHYMEEFGTTEMLRCPLENAVLKAKLLDMGPPPDILGLALTPPNLSDIHNTVLTLKEVGALFTTVNGVYSIQDGDLSFMGRVMAGMPLDIRLMVTDGDLTDGVGGGNKDLGGIQGTPTIGFTGRS